MGGCASATAVVAAALLLSACTVVNQATFGIESPAGTERLLDDIERYFAQLGLQPRDRIDFEFPTKRKERSYFLGQRRGSVPLHTTYGLVVLRMEGTRDLYVDWIEISDTKRIARPGEFDLTHAKIASDLKARFGTEVKFSFIEAK